MQDILIYQRGMRNNALFDPDGRDFGNDPYIYLRDQLRQRGYNLRTIDDQPVTGAARILFFDAESVDRQRLHKYFLDRVAHRESRLQDRDVYQECLAAGHQERMALFLWEGSVVTPRNWRHNLHQRFSTIFTWNDDFVDGKRFHKIHLPQPERFGTTVRRSFQDKKLLVNISGNRYSIHRRELYSQRRASIRHFERTQPDQFDLYGVGWDQPPSLTARLLSIGTPVYKSYRGTVKRKSDIFPHYRFAICYENIRDEPGYITEKLFDCMRSDCVPIYWGASNIRSYVPQEAFIDRTQFKSHIDLESFLIGMNEGEYERYREAISDFLNSPQFAEFSQQRFAETIINVLKLA